MAQLVSSALPAKGYHPVSTTRITLHKPELLTNSNCSLFLYFALPPLIFVDPYELAHYDASYTFRHWGPSNLELPVNAVPQNSSGLLLDVVLPESAHAIEVKLPLHLRYGDLVKGSQSGHHTEELVWPTGFLECPLSMLSAISHPSGLPRLPSEVASLFDPLSATFIPITHVRPNGADLVKVPTGSSGDLAYVEFGTIFTILLSFFYLLRASRLASQRINRASSVKTD
ncbi:PIG-X [Lyophyllum atratum]|nr:PIG-X [Lyophyllum atratum]